MGLYKRIALIENEYDRLDIMDEMIDRYGDMPKPAENLLMIAVSKKSALSTWLLNFEKTQLKNTPSRYSAHKNNAGETVADYEVQINPVVKGE